MERGSTWLDFGTPCSRYLLHIHYFL
ncbi:hypothetical protein Pint_07270 [Pistacia integerrima]|uniref:Uncharacterized protein n=1 Tax=Pistacia integerrima TaxID=434235 RepID=A0ACC0XWD3_9ROSI|nr:hypothetical protein Pint_07270 [Pistacia integerrima]